MTQCTNNRIELKGLGRRFMVAGFDGGTIASDGGATLLGKVDEALGLTERAAGCFGDHRRVDRIEHTVGELLRQRLFALALGYEDLNDHDELSRDPLLAAVVGKVEPAGAGRRRPADRGRALAGKSTLNRLELTAEGATSADRYKKIALDFEAMRLLFVDLFVDAHDAPPEQIVIDLDATDDPLHGKQEGRFFHGYYKGYCYLPLYAFVGDHLLAAELDVASTDAAAGAVALLERVVPRIRRRWRGQTRILVRGDSGFCREAIMAWCEANDVDYVLGLAKNARLKAQIEAEQAEALAAFEAADAPARRFKDFTYQTLDSWSRARRVIAKAEQLAKGANPRFVVTSLSADAYEARALYEDVYCARGEMENRIKEQQLYLFADRTSTRAMRSNQIRLWFSSLAYTLLAGLRRLGLAGTKMARARCDTIRLSLLKIGAAVCVSVRRVKVSMSSVFPRQGLFRRVLARLDVAIAVRRFVPQRC